MLLLQFGHNDEKLEETDRDAYIHLLLDMRAQAYEAGLWLPHMPAEWGGMGLGHVELAMVQAEAAKTYFGPWVLNTGVSPARSRTWHDDAGIPATKNASAGEQSVSSPLPCHTVP